MTPHDFYKNDPPEPVTARDRETWKSVRCELLAYAEYLNTKGMALTAEQIWLAVRLADTHRFVIEV